MDERDEDTRRWIVKKLIDAGALSGECGVRYMVENRAASIYDFIKSGHRNIIGDTAEETDAAE